MVIPDHLVLLEIPALHTVVLPAREHVRMPRRNLDIPDCGHMAWRQKETSSKARQASKMEESLPCHMHFHRAGNRGQ